MQVTKEFRITEPYELYNKFERIVLCTSTESKNLQDFVTQVFIAAGQDLQQDQLFFNNKKRKSVEHLNKFLDDYCSKLLQLNTPKEIQLSQEKIGEFKKVFKNEITTNILNKERYDKLKRDLYHSRIQGVGRSSLDASISTFFTAILSAFILLANTFIFIVKETGIDLSAITPLATTKENIKTALKVALTGNIVNKAFNDACKCVDQTSYITKSLKEIALGNYKIRGKHIKTKGLIQSRAM